MNENDMWESAVRSADDLAGVFEYDEDIGHFYLYKLSNENTEKIIGAIHIVSGAPDFSQEDTSIRWSPDENMVGLFIREQLWAVFNCETGKRFGGNYRMDKAPAIPPMIAQAF